MIIVTPKENSPIISNMCGSNLEEVLGEDSKSLRMVTDALKVGVLIQDGVVGVQEKVEGVLVQEVHLEWYKNNLLFYLVHIRQHRKKTLAMSFSVVIF